MVIFAGWLFSSGMVLHQSRKVAIHQRVSNLAPGPDVELYRKQLYEPTWKMSNTYVVDMVSTLRKGGHLETVQDYAAALVKLRRDDRRVGREAVALYRDMQSKGLEPEAVHLGAVVVALCESKDAKGALDFYDTEKHSTTLDAKAFSKVMGACGKAQRWEQSLQVLQEMQEAEVDPDKLTMTAAINACGACAEWKMAMNLLGDLLRRDIDADVVTFTSVITACEKSHQLGWVKALLQDMWNREVMPNVVTYNSVIKACIYEKKWMEALELVGLMEEEQLRPDRITYNTAIDACATTGKVARSLELFTKMRQQMIRPNKKTYMSLISAAETAGKWEDSLWLLNQAQRYAGLNSNQIESWRKQTISTPKPLYLAALVECKETADWAHAIELLEQMLDDAHDPGNLAYHVVTDIFVSTGSPVGKRILRQVMQSEVFRVSE